MATKNSLENVPARYLRFKTGISEVKQDFRSIRPVSGSSLDLSEPVSKTTIQLPNNGFLVANRCSINGEILIDIKSTSGSDTFANLKPSCPNLTPLFTRFLMTAGGIQIHDQLAMQQLNPLMFSLKSNSIEDLAYSVYGNAEYTTGATAASWKRFKLPVAQKSNQLFGYQENMKSWSSADVILLPLFMLPPITIEVYFSLPSQFVSRDPTYTPVGTLTAQAQVRNLIFDMYLVYAPSLESYYRRNGFSCVYQAYQPVSFNIPPTPANSQITIQLPSSFASLSHVIGQFQIASDLTDLSKVSRAFQGSAQIDGPSSVNILLNSDRRFTQDLDQGSTAGLEQQNLVTLFYESARTSNFIQNFAYSGIKTNQAVNYVLCLPTAYDFQTSNDDPYSGKQLIAGWASANATGGINITIQFNAALTVPHLFNCFLVYNKFFSCSPRGDVKVRY